MASRLREIREDLYLWRGGFVLVKLWRSSGFSGHTPVWRRVLWTLHDWPHTVNCPACNGWGGDMSVGGCEWCGGDSTWDLREDMNDEAWAMLGRKGRADGR